MKLKINKACDLSSISVLPPHARRTNALSSGTDSSVFGKSQASQFRSQQSQHSFSQGMSSQLSQNSLDEILTNEQKFGSQERENSTKKIPCLAPVAYSREETQMPMSRSSNNLTHRWSSAPPPDHRCQVSEELERRIGFMETSLSRFGMILDSVQNDVMQVNKAIKEVLLETEGIRQKLIVYDSSLQLVIKGNEDLKAGIDGNLKLIPNQLRKDLHQFKLEEAVSTLLALPEQIEVQLLKLQHELCGTLTNKIEAMATIMKTSKHEDLEHILPPQRRVCEISQYQKKLPLKERSQSSLVDFSLVFPAKTCNRKALIPKVETENQEWLRPKQASLTDRQQHIKRNQEEISLTEQDTEWRLIIDSDEEIGRPFPCLLEEKETGMGSNLFKEVKGEAERILRKARKRKRKYSNPIIIN